MGIFKRATKTAAKLRMAIAGPAGSGKTYTALILASVLAGPNGKVAVIDTEHGSASKYADLWQFDTVNMKPPYNPDRFVKGIAAAASEGYDVVILDSISHEWNGTGGVLEMVDNAARAMKTTNKFAAWRDVTPKHDKLIEAITGATCHVICTMRSKTEYVLDVDDRGKKSVTKRGMAPVQRDGFEYEFDILMDMDADNVGVITKSRAPVLSGGVFNPPDNQLATTILGWLTGDENKPVEPAPELKPEPPPTAQPDPPQATKPPPPPKDTFPTQSVQEPPPVVPDTDALPGTVEEPNDEDVAKVAAANRPDSTDGWVTAWLSQNQYPIAQQWARDRLNPSKDKDAVFHENHFLNGWKKCFESNDGCGLKNSAVFLVVWRKWVNQKFEELNAAPEPVVEAESSDSQPALSLDEVAEVPF